MRLLKSFVALASSRRRRKSADMAVEDSNPERRNLLVTSLGFIAYYYGGGNFASNDLELELIHIHFNKSRFLAELAWTMLFWFLFRYWQTTRGKFTQAFQGEMSRHYNIELVRNYIERRYVRKAGDTRTGCMPAGLEYDRATGVRSFMFVPQAGGGPVEGRLPIEGPAGHFALWAARIKCAVLEPSFFGYFTPYALAAFAMAGPLYW